MRLKQMHITKNELPSLENCCIAIVGMGYVGLPLAIEFNKTKLSFKTNKKVNFKIIGFDETSTFFRKAV